MVRAIVVREAGGPWTLETVTLPDPGRGQVRVRVDAVGLCRSDLSLTRGELAGPFPMIPGHEGVGTVLSVGPDTEGVSAGDRVLFIWTARCGRCWFCQHGEGQLCQGLSDPPVEPATLADATPAHPALGIGAFAEEIVVSVHSIRSLPVDLPDEQAAVLGCAVATGFGAVRNTARIAPGESVVVVGAGGIGLSVIASARDVGAKPVIAVDPSAERRALALRLGADLAQAPGLTLGRRIRDATGGIGADHVFECVGQAATIRQAWGLARRGGQVVVVGAGRVDDKLQFSAFELFNSGRTLRGSVHGAFDPARDLPLLIDRVAAGGIELSALVEPARGFDGIDAAITALDDGIGARAVFRPRDTGAPAADGPARALPDQRARVLTGYRSHIGEQTARIAETLDLPVESSGAGAYVFDQQGRRYLQCGGYGVFILGHRHPRVVDALHRQLDRHPLATRTLLSAELATAAGQLAAIAPNGLDRVYFGCTGAEAVETAFKLARANGRRRVIAMRGAFHGKTLGALAATDRLAFQQPFRPLLPGVEAVPFGDPEALAIALATGEPACVIVEPVQGEGGVRIPPAGYLAAVSALCREHRALLIVDEIQTGLGRLGSWWGWDVPGAAPDMLLVGKALGGGCVPVSAVLCTPEVFRPLDRNPRLHSSTFSGYPLGMAAVSATLAVLAEEQVPQRAARLGERITALVRAALEPLGPEMVRDVRARGLLLGIDFASPALAGRFSHALLERGVVPTSSLGADTVLRLTPPALLDDSDLELLKAALCGAVAQLSARG